MRASWLETLIGIILAVIGLLSMLWLLYVQDIERNRRLLINTETYCPASKGKTVWGIKRLEPPSAPGGIAIVIDATDVLDEKARESLRSYFSGKEYIESISDFQRVRIYALAEYVGALEKPSFDFCAPPNKMVSPWLDNPRKRREEFEEKFVSVMTAEIDKLAQRDESERSPIMAMLGAISEDNDRVIVVSDMMEHSPPCSLYTNAGRHSYSAFTRRGCIQGADKIRYTHFDVLFISREKLRGLQNSSLVEFWNAHFKENGATTKFRPLAAIAASCEKSANPLVCKACLEPDWLEYFDYCARL